MTFSHVYKWQSQNLGLENSPRSLLKSVNFECFISVPGTSCIAQINGVIKQWLPKATPQTGASLAQVAGLDKMQRPRPQHTKASAQSLCF